MDPIVIVVGIGGARIISNVVFFRKRVQMNPFVLEDGDVELKMPSLEVNKELIGKGRNEQCPCESLGSVECVRRHVKEERIKLKSELKTAFNVWKFDEIGEEVSRLWNTKEQKQFSSLVKSSLSKGKSFFKQALTSPPKKNRQSIVNYYFNVNIPQCIRSSSKTINTDDEEEEEEEAEVTTLKRSRKRNRAKNGASSSSKSVKTKYLSGRL